MSIHRSYFSKNNTIVACSDVNTARNPVTQLFYGKNTTRGCVRTGYSGDTCGTFCDPFFGPLNIATGHTCDGKTGYTLTDITGYTKTNVCGYSRFLFDLDLSGLSQKIKDCCIDVTGTTGGSQNVTHTLRMTNTSSFDDSLLNGTVLMNDTRRATSFTLMLFKVTGNTNWAEGVGYDYLVPDGMFAPEFDQTYSTRPSNWFSSTTLTSWTTDGVYNNFMPSTYEILATQYFDLGNEDIKFNGVRLTNEINHQLTGTPQTISGVTYGVSYIPDLENTNSINESYSVGFFSKYTNTFFEPFLETSYDDYINDARSNFNLRKNNRLFLYLYDSNGQPICLKQPPTVTIRDCNDNIYLTGPSKKLTCGVYYYQVNSFGSLPAGQSVPVEYTDTWSQITRSNGALLPDVTNEFVIYDNAFSVGTTVVEPKVYGYSVSGIKLNEKIKNGDTRKVYVSTRVPYTTDHDVLVDNIKYRIYVKQGTTEVEVTPWTNVNKSFTSNYFLLDTSWMIPNEYFLDIKATSNQQVDTYRKVINFQIVNEI